MPLKLEIVEHYILNPTNRKSFEDKSNSLEHFSEISIVSFLGKIKL